MPRAAKGSLLPCLEPAPPGMYGATAIPPGATKLMVELLAFRDGRTSEQGGMGPARHLINAINLSWPNTQWNGWLKSQITTLAENRVVAWTGCAAGGKTHAAGMFGIEFWLAEPLNTSVILTSTTGKMVRKRIWPVIQDLYHSMHKPPGNLVDSKTTLQTRKGDDKHGIFAIAVREGSTSKAVADIQGLHSPRMLLVIDEGTDVPEAVMEAVANLRKGCRDFRLLIIGNAASRMDPHGRMCEPKDGWKSITVNDEEWPTKGVPEWEIEPGICQHFDGTQSPNIKAGTDKWPFLFTNTDLKRAKDRPGAEQTIGFWKYTRGFWVPEGVCRTVLSEALVSKHDGRGELTFLTHRTRIAGLDPAFGGDQCILRIATVGDISGGRLGVQLEKRYILPVKATSPEPVHYQIMRQVRDICTEEGVAPEHFGLDASGEGGGLADIISMEWSPSIQRIEFGGMPSELPVSEEDKRPAREAYDRRVTELYFSVRAFLLASQLGGLNDDDVKEFSSREFSDEKRKIVLDTKAEYKEKIGRSPDNADAVAVAVEVARRMGAAANPIRRNGRANDWMDVLRDYDEVNVTPEMENEDVYEVALV